MEKEQQMKLKTLVADWKQLKAQIAEQNNFSRETFEQIFDNTYPLLAPCSILNAVDKEYMALVVAMHDFISAPLSGLGKEYNAALVVTERFLYHCIIRPAAYVEQVECTTVYAVESCEDIVVDFTNVSATINVLTAAMKE